MATSQEDHDPEWIRKLKHGGALPFLPPHLCSHGWSSPPGKTFMVRGPHYLHSKLKIPASDWLLHPLAFDWIKSSSKINGIMKHPNSRVCRTVSLLQESLHGSSRKEKFLNYSHESSRPFFWTINLQVPSKDNHSLIMYYVAFEQPPKDSLMQRFLDGDNAFRNSRFKLLANVVQGPWIVKTAVGERAVCLLGKAVTCNYIRGENFMEIDVDIGSSMMANAIVHLAFGYVTSLTVDLAFVLEGQTPNELPERILGAIRFANLDPEMASTLDSDNSLREEFKERPSFKFWRSIFHAGHQDPVANVEEDEEIDSQEEKTLS